MGAAVITLDIDSTEMLGQYRQISGSIHLSSSYANGTGDTSTVGALALGILRDFQAINTTYNLVMTDTLPVVGPGTTIHFKAFGTGASDNHVFDEISNSTDLSGISMRFIAYGW